MTFFGLPKDLSNKADEETLGLKYSFWSISAAQSKLTIDCSTLPSPNSASASASLLNESSLSLELPYSFFCSSLSFEGELN